jgi:hypothetical protein
MTEIQKAEAVDSMVVLNCDNENLSGRYLFCQQAMDKNVLTTLITLLDLTPVLQQCKLLSGPQMLRHLATSPMVLKLSSS